jgi:hypothetical protein
VINAVPRIGPPKGKQQMTLKIKLSATTQGGIPFPDVFAVCNGSSESHTDIPQEPNVESAIANLPSEQISGQA